MATANALRVNIDADDDRAGVLLHVAGHPLQERCQHERK